MDAGGGVEERVLAAVVVIGRGVHEGSRHHWDLTGEEKQRHLNVRNVCQIVFEEERKKAWQVKHYWCYNKLLPPLVNQWNNMQRFAHLQKGIIQ